jgi:hypothetical protein
MTATSLSARAVLVSLLASEGFRPNFHAMTDVAPELRKSCTTYWNAILRGLRDGLSVQKAIAAEREVRISEGQSAMDASAVMEIVRAHFAPAYERATQIVAAATAFDAHAAEEVERMRMRAK